MVFQSFKEANIFSKTELQASLKSITIYDYFIDNFDFKKLQLSETFVKDI